MISEREELSREIRKALGRCNDNDRPVTVLVSESIAALTAQAERIVEMEAFVKTAAGPAYRDTTLGKAARALLEGKTS